MAVLYASNIGQVNLDWLAAAARDAGLTRTQALDAVLAEARERGWTLRGRPAQVVE